MLKKYLLLLLFILGANLFLNAQEYTTRNCATEILHNQKLANSPKYRESRARVEERAKDYWKNSEQKIAEGIRVIPVYVHVVYDEAVPEQNISDAQIQSQIDVINLDFRKLNADVGNVPAEFAGLVSDYELEFELVGVTRKASTVTEWGFTDNVKRSSDGGVDPITPETHLNIWVCVIGESTLGYAQFPGGDPLTDGVVNAPQFFGSKNAAGSENFYLQQGYDEGRTLTHEIGHYLNLYHIWGDGNCDADDEVEDTPPAAADNAGCPAYPTKSCEQNPYTSDMFMNYMDYVDDACMFMFTEGQKARTTPIFAAGGARENLGYLKDDGCDLQAPSNLSASNIADTGFTITWDVVDGADSYDISLDENITNVNSTSYTFQNLSLATTYEVQVRANCAAGGNGTYSNVLSVNTTGCPEGPANLTIIPDNYASEISWTLNLNGSIVASGDGYTDGDTNPITQAINFGAGNYEFTINDSFGDGICCAEGNGSYTITDFNGNTIVSGGEYVATETKTFCLQAAKQDQVLTIDPIEDKLTNDADFAVNATVDSGLELTYSLSGPATINGNVISLTGDAGTVTVEVSQAGDDTYNPVSGSESFNVIDVCANFDATVTDIRDASCSGLNDGSFTIVAEGGSNNYSYTLNGNTQDTGVFTEMVAGIYLITVSDENQCSVEFEIEIFEPSPIVATANITNNTSIDGNGSISTTISGGSGQYSYEWGTGETTSSLENLMPGEYVLTVTDENNCSIVETFTVGGITSNAEKMPENVVVFPNPTNDNLTIQHPDLPVNAVIYIYDAKGVLIESLISSNGETKLDLRNRESGLYFIQLESKGAVIRIVKE